MDRCSKIYNIYIWSRPRDYSGHSAPYLMAEYLGDLYFALAPNSPRVYRIGADGLEEVFDPSKFYRVDAVDGIGTWYAVKVWRDELYMGGWLALGFEPRRDRKAVWSKKFPWVGKFDGRHWADVYRGPLYGPDYYYAEATDMEIYQDTLFVAFGDGAAGFLGAVKSEVEKALVDKEYQPLALTMFEDQLAIVETGINKGGTFPPMRVSLWDGETRRTVLEDRARPPTNIERIKGRLYAFSEAGFYLINRDLSYMWVNLFKTYKPYRLALRPPISFIEGKAIVFANLTDFPDVGEPVDATAYMMAFDGARFTILRQMPSSVRGMATCCGRLWIGGADYLTPHAFYPDAVPYVRSYAPDEALSRQPVYVPVWRGAYNKGEDIGYIPIGGFNKKSIRVRADVGGKLTILSGYDFDDKDDWDVYDVVSLEPKKPVRIDVYSDFNYIAFIFDEKASDLRIDINLIP
ncbi:MAG: hypothetical protein TU35_009095 [Thermoproteus sp. AZ2]|uniref:Uncharacterized protein n=1 Tax=Thermoproteus sp. AZ2 TaxID=1609232 RepID=A0ACC6V2X9_9CREN